MKWKEVCEVWLLAKDQSYFLKRNEKCCEWYVKIRLFVKNTKLKLISSQIERFGSIQSQSFLLE